MEEIQKRHPDLAKLAVFLADYASALLSAGATTLRVEKNIGRIAEQYGAKVMAFIMPRHTQITVIRGNDRVECMCEPQSGINFYAITILSRLSWKIVEDNLPLENAKQLLEYIKRHKRLPLKWVTLMAGLANASFCRLFGGDYHAMGLVFLATIVGFCLKHILVEKKINWRIATIAASTVSVVIASMSHTYGIGMTHGVAVATSVLYLVPGIPFINSVSDMMHNHYLCAFSRLMFALEITICLGIGFFIGISLMR